MFQKFHLFPYYYFILLTCLLFPPTLSAQPIQYCDSLIQSGIKAMWKKDHVKSLELLTEAKNMAAKNRWYKQQFLATNNIGANYYTMLDYGEALNYYLESYTIAVKKLEPAYEMIVLNNIAILYSKEKNYEKAYEYFKKAYQIAKQNKDLLKVGLYAMNLGNVANETGELRQARIYFNEALPNLKTQPEMYILAQIAIAENDLLQRQPEKARNTALQLYKTTKDLNYNDIGISLLFIISKSYLKENNAEEALRYAFKIKETQPNLETKKALFELLSDIYTQQQEYPVALRYKDSVIANEQRLNEIKNGKLFENSRVKFEIQNYKNEIALNESKLSNERKIFYSIIAIISIVVFFVLWTYRNITIKHKQRKLIAERNEKILVLELEKEKSDNLLLEEQFKERETAALLEQEKLKNEIELKNRKLSAKALYLSGRNQLIEEILQSLSKIPELPKHISLSNHISTLKSHLKTDTEWDSFITHFEEVNQGFLSILKQKHPGLTANDIRFISYIYMSLSTKEIASMLNITPEACRKRKERISAKIGISENIPLYDYLSTL